MLGGLFSFLGGAAFRWLFGELITVYKDRAERKHELQMVRHQDWMAEQATKRKIAEYKAAADAGVQIIEAKADADAQRMADEAFNLAIKGVNDASMRSDWIGKFNAFIRPELAQISIMLLVGQALFPNHVTLTPLMVELIAGVLGVFVGERIKTRSA